MASILNKTVPAARLAVSTAPATQVRTMATLRDIKNRINSVTNISKITKSMKMVAASKLKQSETRLAIARPFYAAESGVWNKMVGDEENETKEVKKELIVLITSDRGLCGGVNSSACKAVKAKVKPADKDYEILCVGDKGVSQCQREYANLFETSFKDIGRVPVNMLQASFVAEAILNKEFDKCTVVYNHFKNVIAQDVTFSSFDNLEGTKEKALALSEYEFDTPVEGIQNLYEFHVGSSIYYALAENATSENAARMSAMDNATRNAGDMISKLTLTYNRTRQSKITTELIEIISGAEAL